ncbi:hypothetical protein BB560_004355 [Smittium megazygosporum]|uniref:Nucleoside diphosphate kinase n=1 Tax=Smittium megazygosporum TaxID=133381 RepID=A0A2T9Z9F5_9FUNG|nr:hypothetical protein BB560_004355 [Smittium megazygosporum]
MFILLKPFGLNHFIFNLTLNKLKDANLTVSQEKFVWLSKENLCILYPDLVTPDTSKTLISHFTSSPCLALHVSGPDSVSVVSSVLSSEDIVSEFKKRLDALNPGFDFGTTDLYVFSKDAEASEHELEYIFSDSIESLDVADVYSLASPQPLPTTNVELFVTFTPKLENIKKTLVDVLPRCGLFFVSKYPTTLSLEKIKLLYSNVYSESDQVPDIESQLKSLTGKDFYFISLVGERAPEKSKLIIGSLKDAHNYSFSSTFQIDNPFGGFILSIRPNGEVFQFNDMFKSATLKKKKNRKASKSQPAAEQKPEQPAPLLESNNSANIVSSVPVTTEPVPGAVRTENTATQPQLADKEIPATSTENEQDQHTVKGANAKIEQTKASDDSVVPEIDTNPVVLEPESDKAVDNVQEADGLHEDASNVIGSIVQEPASIPTDNVQPVDTAADVHEQGSGLPTLETPSETKEKPKEKQLASETPTEENLKKVTEDFSKISLPSQNEQDAARNETSAVRTKSPSQKTTPSRVRESPFITMDKVLRSGVSSNAQSENEDQHLPPAAKPISRPPSFEEKLKKLEKVYEKKAEQELKKIPESMKIKRPKKEPELKKLDEKTEPSVDNLTEKLESIKVEEQDLAKEPKEMEDVKEVKEPKEPKEVKEVKEGAELKDAKEGAVAKDPEANSGKEIGSEEAPTEEKLDNRSKTPVHEEPEPKAGKEVAVDTEKQPVENSKSSETTASDEKKPEKSLEVSAVKKATGTSASAKQPPKSPSARSREPLRTGRVGAGSSVKANSTKAAGVPTPASSSIPKSEARYASRPVLSFMKPTSSSITRTALKKAEAKEVVGSGVQGSPSGNPLRSAGGVASHPEVRSGEKQVKGTVSSSTIVASSSKIAREQQRAGEDHGRPAARSAKPAVPRVGRSTGPSSTIPRSNGAYDHSARGEAAENQTGYTRKPPLPKQARQARE